MDCYGLCNLCYGLVDALVMDNCITDALVICDSCGKYMIFVVCQIEMQKTKKGKKILCRVLALGKGPFAERIYHSARKAGKPMLLRFLALPSATVIALGKDFFLKIISLPIAALCKKIFF